MVEIAIVVTDTQLAIKANRNANVGFYFCSIGAAYKTNTKFNIILFTCNLHTEVMEKWANSFIRTCLESDGKVFGFIDEPTESVKSEKIVIDEPTTIILDSLKEATELKSNKDESNKDESNKFEYKSKRKTLMKKSDKDDSFVSNYKDTKTTKTNT